MKTCLGCGLEKPDEVFNWKVKKKGRRQPRCKDCMRGYTTLLYRASEKRRLDTIRRTIASRVKLQRVVWDYLKDHPCVDCGEADPVVLEFDHRERETKYQNVGRLTRLGSPKRLLDEIAKCDVRCANCHKRRTAIQFGWKKAA